MNILGDKQYKVDEKTKVIYIQRDISEKNAAEIQNKEKYQIVWVSNYYSKA